MGLGLRTESIFKHLPGEHDQKKHGDWAKGLTVNDYEGRLGDRSHVTRRAKGTISTSHIAQLGGVKGEVPGEHRNRTGERWEAFKADIAERGIQTPLFITVDYDEPPKISEGNHRRDAAVELGLKEVPVEIRFFGKAEWPERSVPPLPEFPIRHAVGQPNVWDDHRLVFADSGDGGELHDKKMTWMRSLAHKRGIDPAAVEAIDEALFRATDSEMFSSDTLSGAVGGTGPLSQGIELQREWTRAAWKRLGLGETIAVTRAIRLDEGNAPEGSGISSWVVAENKSQVAGWYDRRGIGVLWVERDVGPEDVLAIPWAEGRLRSNFVRIHGEVLVLPFAPIAKHTPGGVDHDQSKHGNRGAVGSTQSSPALSSNSGKYRIPVNEEWRYDWSPLQSVAGSKASIYERHITSGRMTEENKRAIKDLNVYGIKERIKNDPDVIDYSEALGEWNREWFSGKHRDAYPYGPSNPSRYSGTSEDVGVENFVDSALKSWADWGHRESDAIQHAIEDEFGVHQKGAPSRFSDEDLEMLYTAGRRVSAEVGKSAWQAFIRGTYEETQDYLEHAPDHIILFRGLRGLKHSREMNHSLQRWSFFHETMDADTPIYTDAVLAGRPVSSWSASYQTAEDFVPVSPRDSGLILTAVVPKRAIISTAGSGFGAASEDEIVVIDTGHNVVTVAPATQPRLYKESRLDTVYNRVSLFGDAGPNSRRKTRIAGTRQYVEDMRDAIWVDSEIDYRYVPESEVEELYGSVEKRARPLPEIVPEREDEEWLKAKPEPVKKHTPGGVGHDQKKHGNDRVRRAPDRGPDNIFSTEEVAATVAYSLMSRYPGIMRYEDPSACEGECIRAEAAINQFLDENYPDLYYKDLYVIGIDESHMSDDRAMSMDWDYTGNPDTVRKYQNHNIPMMSLDGKEWVTLDFTYRQFEPDSEFPLIEPEAIARGRWEQIQEFNYRAPTEELKKHTPGGVSHDQDKHGDREGAGLGLGPVNVPGLTKPAPTSSGRIRHKPEAEVDAMYAGASKAMEAGDDDLASEFFTRGRALKTKWKEDLEDAISLGELEPEDAKNYGYESWDADNPWMPLPDTVYHVTTAASAVKEQGLKSRHELEQGSGKGLGGGARDTISFSGDAKIASEIRDSMLDMHSVVNFNVTMDELIERAKTGDRGSEPFYDIWLGKLDEKAYENEVGGLQEWTETYRPYGQPQSREGVLEAVNMRDPGFENLKPIESTRAGTSDKYYGWTWDVSEVRQRERMGGQMKRFLSWREHKGGIENPLFFSSDLEGFAAAPKSEIELLTFHPSNPNVKGQQLGGPLGEWRTTTGEATVLDERHKIAKHRPGGQDHDQKRHGRRGMGINSSPTMAEEHAEALRGGYVLGGGGRKHKIPKKGTPFPVIEPGELRYSDEAFGTSVRYSDKAFGTSDRDARDARGEALERLLAKTEADVALAKADPIGAYKQLGAHYDRLAYERGHVFEEFNSLNVTGRSDRLRELRNERRFGGGLSTDKGVELDELEEEYEALEEEGSVRRGALKARQFVLDKEIFATHDVMDRVKSDAAAAYTARGHEIRAEIATMAAEPQSIPKFSIVNEEGGVQDRRRPTYIHARDLPEYGECSKPKGRHWNTGTNLPSSTTLIGDRKDSVV